MDDSQRELDVLIRARYPILYLVSWEEPRVMRTLRQIARNGRGIVPGRACTGPLVSGNFAPDQMDRNIFTVQREGHRDAGGDDG